MNYLKRSALNLDLCLVLLLVILTFLVYLGALDNNFLINWDDDKYITANPDIQGFNVDNLKNIFSKYYVGNWAPLQMLSYMFDFHLWGLKPFGFILHNIFLHSLNGALLYLFLRALNTSPLAAFLGATLFLIHPVQVESVAWISQRKNLLSMFFFLLSLIAYHHYVVKEKLSKTFFCLANISFLFALLAKSAAVVLPVVLVAYDFLLRRFDRGWKRCATEKAPFVLMAFIFAWLAVISQSTPTMEFQGGIPREYHGGSAYATFLTMLTVYQKYLTNIFWPTGLSATYSKDILFAADSRVVLPILLLLVTACSPLFFKKNDRYKGLFWVLVFLVGFLPVLQIVPLFTLMQDRYLYFPMLGLCGFTALALDTLPLPASKIAVLFLGLFLVTMSFITVERIEVWNNPTSLWKDAAAKEQGSALAWHALGLAYYNDGDYQKAIEASSQALQIKPSYLDASNTLALAHVMEGRFQDAQLALQELLRQSPKNYNGILLMAHTYYFQNDFNKARNLYLVAKRMNPTHADAWNLLSLVELRAGNYDLSSRYWQKALSLGGKETDLFLNRARLESLKRDSPASLEFLQQAINLGFKDIDLLYSDRDLEFVRSQSDFSKLISKY